MLVAELLTALVALQLLLSLLQLLHYFVLLLQLHLVHLHFLLLPAVLFCVVCIFGLLLLLQQIDLIPQTKRILPEGVILLLHVFINFLQLGDSPNVAKFLLELLFLKIIPLCLHLIIYLCYIYAINSAEDK